jgi:capsular polysaccharide transport system permease protein
MQSSVMSVIARIRALFAEALQWLRESPGFVLLVLMPIVLLSFYYALIATDRYVSEAKLTVKKTDQADSSSLSSSLLGGSSGKEDSLFLKEYILGFDMLDHLDRKLGLRKAYEDRKADYFSRLTPIPFYDITREDFMNYYQNHIDLSYDDTANVLTIRVDTFDPKYSRKVNQSILDQCEQYMNDVSHKIADEQMKFVENELVRVKARMEQAKIRMAEFQNKYNVVDPAAQAAAAQALVADMEKSLIAMEADLANLRSFTSENSYMVTTMKEKVEAFRQQIAKEKKILASTGGDRLNELALKFINIKADADYILGVYQADLTALEKVRVDASRKLKNVITIETPTLQERAEYPRRLYNIALILIIFTVVYMIARLIVATIKEHKE